MKKLLFLYSQIWDFVAETFIQGLNDADEEDQEVVVRINSPGGSVFAGWGMVAAVTEFTGKLKLKVDGVAASMAFYILLFNADNECSDISRFMVHPASGYANSNEAKQLLADVNKDLKAKMKERFDPLLFEKTTGITIDNLFKDNITIWLDAKQAKKLTLIKKINRLNTAEQKAFSSLVACGSFEEEQETHEEVPKPVSWDNILSNIQNN